MPTRALRPCAAPNCAALVTRGYCAAHGHRTRTLERWRGSSTERGYDAAWRRFRAWFIQQPENVMCADCKQEFTQEVHHVKKLRDFPELRLNPANCRGLCKACHSARTLRNE